MSQEYMVQVLVNSAVGGGHSKMGPSWDMVFDVFAYLIFKSSLGFCYICTNIGRYSLVR